VCGRERGGGGCEGRERGGGGCERGEGVDVREGRGEGVDLREGRGGGRVNAREQRGEVGVDARINNSKEREGCNGISSWRTVFK